MRGGEKKMWLLNVLYIKMRKLMKAGIFKWYLQVCDLKN